MKRGLVSIFVPSALAFGLGACSPRTVDATGGRGGKPPGAGGAGFEVPGELPALESCTTPCEDFPSAPINEGTTADATKRFADAKAGQGAGPCIVEPESGAMIPFNWIRPRFRWLPGAADVAYELRIKSDKQKHELVVHTSKPEWTMSEALWKAIGQKLRGATLQISVRALANGSTTPSGGSDATLVIAPVAAEGSIVYWTTRGGDAFDPEATELQGFEAGSEKVLTVLRPAQVEQVTGDWNPTMTQPVKCVGCHASTPDGLYVGFTAQPPWGNVLAGVKPAIAGKKPPYLTDFAVQALSQKQLGIMTFSSAFWATGRRYAVSPYGDDVDEGIKPTKLVWFDLEATEAGEGKAWGALARTGDTRSVGAPDWSHSGSTIVYTSTRIQTTGRIGGSEPKHPAPAEADLYTVPFNNKQGGPATPLNGAADPNANECYPDYSPDDQLVAFNRVPTGVSTYDQPMAEVFVVPASGGTAVRLQANDPVACSGLKSPGVKNSWAKWAPNVGRAGADEHYWITFSSDRFGGKPQLFLAAVVRSGDTIKTYPAIYMWNQPQDTGNHTPAWDSFVLTE